MILDPATLSPEQRVRLPRWALYVDWSAPMREIADEVGVSYERVRQVRARLAEMKLMPE
jgi:DNA-directed RNA polymerase sigma subunit (sigma70/sigma32)